VPSVNECKCGLVQAKQIKMMIKFIVILKLSNVICSGTLPRALWPSRSQKHGKVSHSMTDCRASPLPELVSILSQMQRQPDLCKKKSPSGLLPSYAVPSNWGRCFGIDLKEAYLIWHIFCWGHACKDFRTLTYYSLKSLLMKSAIVLWCRAHNGNPAEMALWAEPSPPFLLGVSVGRDTFPGTG
jgi:hypothetical protein